jgi:hypothetical protein
MYYKIQVATDTEFQNIVYSDLITDGSTQAIFDELDYYTTYYWRVKTINQVTGQESEWSDWCMFTTKDEDIIGLHATSNVYYISVNNMLNAAGRKCRSIEFDLNNLRADVNYPVSSGSCELIGFELSALTNRNV